jgi:hypothetical protein
MKRVNCLVTLLTLSVGVGHVQAQAGGEPREGLASAQQNCSECHATQRGQVRSKLTGTDILRACNRSRNDDCCLNGSPYDAACWDANVQAYD